AFSRLRLALARTWGAAPPWSTHTVPPGTGRRLQRSPVVFAVAVQRRCSFMGFNRLVARSWGQHARGSAGLAVTASDWCPNFVLRALGRPRGVWVPAARVGACGAWFWVTVQRAVRAPMVWVLVPRVVALRGSCQTCWPVWPAVSWHWMLRPVPGMRVRCWHWGGGAVVRVVMAGLLGRAVVAGGVGGVVGGCRG